MSLGLMCRRKETKKNWSGAYVKRVAWTGPTKAPHAPPIFEILNRKIVDLSMADCSSSNTNVYALLISHTYASYAKVSKISFEFLKAQKAGNRLSGFFLPRRIEQVRKLPIKPDTIHSYQFKPVDVSLVYHKAIFAKMCCRKDVLH